ncbi:hypothetical protein LSH36_60g03011 [Paralvinella palmiformis]|uniref:Uncharacterized protein n=1 Tax=Paralvinella palmiformis TaxID=53620 RepID=A0AAD9K521_9ANNE|nr:hypothetical protein LSH36_60g03011 [Paralvinella palmiformis]
MYSHSSPSRYTKLTCQVLYYESIITKLDNYKHDKIIGTDQKFDYINIDQHKNTEDLFDTFITNGFLLTITKPTRIPYTSTTLIDNIYVSTKFQPHVHSAILTVDISDHLPHTFKQKQTKNN